MKTSSPGRQEAESKSSAEELSADPFQLKSTIEGLTNPGTYRPSRVSRAFWTTPIPPLDLDLQARGKLGKVSLIIPHGRCLIEPLTDEELTVDHLDRSLRVVP
jgi:hypothetical protein